MRKKNENDSSKTSQLFDAKKKICNNNILKSYSKAKLSEMVYFKTELESGKKNCET